MCEHPECRCAAEGIEREGRRYCSEECAAQGHADEPCDCGHPDCA